jgi:predicted Zn-dependent protease
MLSLEPPDTHHFSAALGWMELGNPAEARLELARLSAASAELPDVLEVRWAVAATDADWTEALAVARKLIRLDPNRCSGWLHQAYALRRVPDGGLQAAWDSLLPIVDQFPNEPTIPYNMACYACQLRQLDAARDWLERAVRAGEKARIKRMALSDHDLEALWPEIQDW